VSTIQDRSKWNDLDKILFRQQWYPGMIIGFAKVEGNLDWNRNRINLYRNTQILILEFE
jgi:hypothetical protein